MKKLDTLYRKAPHIESPSTLDDRVQQMARYRKPHPANAQPIDAQSPGVGSSASPLSARWRVAGYAVSFLCVFGIGLGVLLQAGFIPGYYAPSGELADVDTTAREPGKASNSPARESTRTASQSRQSEESITAADAATSAKIASRTPVESSPVAPVREGPVKERLVKERVDANTASQNMSSLSIETSGDESRAGLAAQAESFSAADSDGADSIAAPQTSIAELTGALPVTRTGDWLRARPATQYTVQIAVGSAADSLVMIAGQLPLATELVQINDGTTGWVLLHGSFNDRQTAEKVLSDFAAITDLSSGSAEAANGAAVVAAQPAIIRYAELQSRLK